MRQLESQLQQACHTWMKLMHPDITAFSIPNEGLRSRKTSVRLKANGMMSGVADYFVMLSNHYYCGLFIEFKIGKNKQRPSQKAFEQRCISNQYKYKVVRSTDEFIETINNYLND